MKLAAEAVRLGPELESWLAGELSVAILRSDYVPRASWAAAIGIVRGGESTRVVSRRAHASWLARNGLESSARECLRMQVPRGHILVWLEVEAPGVATAGFFVFDLARALAEVP